MKTLRVLLRREFVELPAVFLLFREGRLLSWPGAAPTLSRQDARNDRRDDEDDEAVEERAQEGLLGT